MLLFIFIELTIIALTCLLCFISNRIYSPLACTTAILLIILIFIFPFIWGSLHGFINYVESNDKDKVRITAITQEQNLLKTYYKIEVEYLTNTPTQQGMITNYNIEKDTYYCYITDTELVNKLKDNLYKEIWVTSGHKGGYENYKDFGTKLIKDIEIIAE